MYFLRRTHVCEVSRLTVWCLLKEEWRFTCADDRVIWSAWAGRWADVCSRLHATFWYGSLCGTYTIFLFSSSSFEDACNLFRDFFFFLIFLAQISRSYIAVFYISVILNLIDRSWDGCVKRMDCCTTTERWVAVYCQYRCLSFSLFFSLSLPLCLYLYLSVDLVISLTVFLPSWSFFSSH